jgi:hypothetical protein
MLGVNEKRQPVIQSGARKRHTWTSVERAEESSQAVDLTTSKRVASLLLCNVCYEDDLVGHVSQQTEWKVVDFRPAIEDETHVHQDALQHSHHTRKTGRDDGLNTFQQADYYRRALRELVGVQLIRLSNRIC